MTNDARTEQNRTKKGFLIKRYGAVMSNDLNMQLSYLSFTAPELELIETQLKNMAHTQGLEDNRKYDEKHKHKVKFA